MKLPLSLPCSTLFITALAAQASPLANQPAVIAALNAGQRVTAIVDLNQCVPQNGTSSSQSQGGLVISAYRVSPDGTLAFSDTHPTVSPSGKPIIQILRYRVASNGNITFLASMFNLPDYSPINQSNFSCTLGKGVSFVSAS